MTMHGALKKEVRTTCRRITDCADHSNVLIPTTLRGPYQSGASSSRTFSPLSGSDHGPVVDISHGVFQSRLKTSLFTARAYARAVLGLVILSVCLSVRLSVTHVDCDKTK